MNSLKKRLSKPLPLKQRTSSVDARRDYNVSTWYSVLGLLKLREYFITVDHFSIWRRHLAWAMEDGKNLRDYMTQRYASSMVFMSLLLSTELNVLFNSSQVTTQMRYSLRHEEYWLISFWIGIMIITSAVLTLLSLISTYTAWCMVSSIHERNAHCIFRSSIGQYVAELPGRFIVGSIYSFLLWVMMFLFMLLPVGFWSIALVGASILLFMHTICCFSAFGRIIMHSGAMAQEKVFDQNYESNLLPHSLHAHLLARARANLSKNTSILRQYRSNSRPRPIDHFHDETDEELGSLMNKKGHGATEKGLLDNAISLTARTLTGANKVGYEDQHDAKDYNSNSAFHYSNSNNNQHWDDIYPPAEPRSRADSTVRFADEVDMVKSSPPQGEQARRRANNDSLMVAVPEGDDTPLSETSHSANSVATNNTIADELKSKLFSQQEEEETLPNVSRPPRPGMVRRDRSNTTAHEGNMDAIFEIGKPKATNATANRLPDFDLKIPSTQQRGLLFANRAESDSALNNTLDKQGEWSHRLSSTTETHRVGRPSATTGRNAFGMHSPWPSNAPGLSVLENAAKLKQQWQNSHVSSSESDQHRSAENFQTPSKGGPTRSHSAIESSRSLQQLWVSSSPALSASDTKQTHRKNDFVAGHRPLTPTNQNSSTNNTSPEEGQSTSMSHGSSAGLLSEEEEEAYMRDYGSFGELPFTQDGLDDDYGWESGADADNNDNERATLLNHSKQEKSHAANYLSLDDVTPKQSGTGSRKQAPPED